MILAVALFAVSALAAIPAFERDRAGVNGRDGLFVGDGANGVVLSAPLHLEWTFNRNDLFDGRIRPCRYLKHAEVVKRIEAGERNSWFLHDLEMPDGTTQGMTMSAARLQVGYFKDIVWHSPTVPKVSERLTMANGTHRFWVEAPWARGEVTTLADRSRDVVAIRLRDADGAHAHFLTLSRFEDVRLPDAPDWETADDGAVSFEQKLPDGRTYAVAVLTTATNLTVEAEGRDAAFRQTGDVDAFVAVRCSRAGAAPRTAALSAVRDAARDGFPALAASNAAWWRDFWARGGRVSLPDRPDLERQWHYSIYQLAASFGKAPMPALNGLAYEPLNAHAAGYQCLGYTHDQNAQMPMFPFLAANHPEMLASFADTYLAVTNELRRQTREVFGTEGFAVPLVMNQDGREFPLAEYRYTLCGAAYAGLVLSLGWRYSRDRTFLREKAYPLLRGFSDFYLGLMKKGEDGVWHLDWNVPPEIFTFTRDETATIALLKPCLETAVEAAKLFGVDAVERARWEDVLAHYPTPAVHSEGGWWCGPDVPDDHYMFGGHLLYPIFPAGSFPDEKIARRTLDYYWTRGFEISYATDRPHPAHDWSAWLVTSAMYRLGMYREAWEMTENFLRWFGKPNGLFSHNPVIETDLAPERIRANLARTATNRRRMYDGTYFDVPKGNGRDLTVNPEAKRQAPSVIEGGAVFAFLVNEALLQVRDGKVVVFPGLPRGSSASFENFRTIDGRTVSATLEKGVVTLVQEEGAK